ncbi:MAG TPA: hypothetical protein VGD21_00455 [Lysobacter sp.]
MKTASTNASSFPFQLNWSSQDIADAVPLRLFELFEFDAGTDVVAPCANRPQPPRPWHRGYLRANDLPAFVRIRS